MPYKIKKNKNKNSYKVYNEDTGKIYSKCTTKEKAEAQIRLLRMLENK